MFKFSKSERLCSKLLIDKLFNEGKSFYEAPFKVIWLETGLQKTEPLTEILISVPKKNIKTAVARNTIKRKIREAFRLNKSILFNQLKPEQKKYVLAFIFTGKQIVDFDMIQNKIILILHRLSKEIKKNLQT